MRIELDNTGIVEGDNDAPQAMGDANVEVRCSLEVPFRSFRLFLLGR